MEGNKISLFRPQEWRGMAHPRSQIQMYYPEDDGNLLWYLIRLSYLEEKKSVILVCDWNIFALVPFPWRHRNFMMCVRVHKTKRTTNCSVFGPSIRLAKVHDAGRKESFKMKQKQRAPKMLTGITCGEVRDRIIHDWLSALARSCNAWLDGQSSLSHADKQAHKDMQES